jgi:hypothetical protein
MTDDRQMIEKMIRRADWPSAVKRYPHTVTQALDTFTDRTIEWVENHLGLQKQEA